MSISDVMMNGMNSKIQRMKKIKSFLRLQSSPQSITQIHEALVRRLGLEISRKTIERDIDDLLEAGRLTILEGSPAKYSLAGAQDIDITLRVDEINTLISLLRPESELALKLRSYLARES